MIRVRQLSAAVRGGLEVLFTIARGRVLSLFSLDLSALFRFMASYDTARRGSEQSVMHGVMTSNASYDSALKTLGGKAECSKSSTYSSYAIGWPRRRKS